MDYWDALPQWLKDYLGAFFALRTTRHQIDDKRPEFLENNAHLLTMWKMISPSFDSASYDREVADFNRQMEAIRTEFNMGTINAAEMAERQSEIDLPDMNAERFHIYQDFYIFADTKTGFDDIQIPDELITSDEPVGFESSYAPVRCRDIDAPDVPIEMIPNRFLRQLIIDVPKCSSASESDMDMYMNIIEQRFTNDEELKMEFWSGVSKRNWHLYSDTTESYLKRLTEWPYDANTLMEMRTIPPVFMCGREYLIEAACEPFTNNRTLAGIVIGNRCRRALQFLDKKCRQQLGTGMSILL